MKNSEDIQSEYEGGERLEMEKYILVVLFLVQQRWGYVINKIFAEDGITTKQWLMLIIISQAFNHYPSLQEVADAMSTTHQNVKQLASRLEKRGFLTIKRDPHNRRILRLKTTPACQEYWEKRTRDDAQSISALFQGLENEEIKQLFQIMGKLDNISTNLYQQAKG
ncbi:MAG: MarR family transcriptional regulator [Methanobacterium sp.]|nr:MAG: MarR family transcriptional regulator [Methanobacterium sp.]